MQIAKGHIKRYPVYLVTMEMHVKATAHPDENSWWHQILVRTKATGALLCPWRGPSALRSLGNGSSFRSETCPPCSPAVPALDACPGGVETHIPTVLGMNAHSCFIRSLRTGNNACVHSPVELPVRARCPAVEGSWPLMGRTASGCCPAHWKPDTNESITWNSRKGVTALPCQGGSAVSGGPGGQRRAGQSALCPEWGSGARACPLSPFITPRTSSVYVMLYVSYTSTRLLFKNAYSGSEKIGYFYVSALFFQLVVEVQVELTEHQRDEVVCLHTAPLLVWIIV